MSRWGSGGLAAKARAAWLAATLFAAVLLMWAPGRWINPSLFETSTLALGAVTAAALAYAPGAAGGGFPLIPLAAAAGWGVFQILAGHTVCRWNSWLAVVNWLVCLAAFLAAWQVCGAAEMRRAFLKALLYFGFVLSVVSAMQYFSAGGKVFWLYQAYEGDILGPFVSRDRYAAFIELLLPIAIAEALRGEGFWRYAAMGAAMYASVIAGASRAGALLATGEIACVLAIAWLKGQSSKSNLRSATATFWLLAMAFSAVVGWVVVWNRLQDPDPLRGRREIYAATVSMVRERPLFGFGLGNFADAYPRYAVTDFGAVVNHAHNDWLEWAADGGIAFALLPLSVAIWSIPRAVRNPWGLGAVAVFVHSAVDFPLQDPVIQVWLFAMLGALAGAAWKSRPPGGEMAGING